MNEKIVTAIEKFDQLPIRMRLLITLVAIMTLGLAVDSLWVASNSQNAKLLKDQITQVDKTIIEIINAQNELNANVVNQRNHPVKKQLAQVQEQIKTIKLELQEKTINLVKPELMSSVLGDIIQRTNKLKLISLIKQPPQALFDTNDKQQKVQMYRHLIELVLRGKYSDTQHFLSQLENMPQKINFENFEYEVEEYPNSIIRLTVSTLSLDKKWIGG